MCRACQETVEGDPDEHTCANGPGPFEFRYNYKAVRLPTAAPERFEPALVDYVLHLGETANWFNEPALGILRAVDIEPSRLARVAAHVLRRGVGGGDLAAEILAPLVHLIDHAQTAFPVIPAAMDMALPDHRDHIGARYREPTRNC